MVVSSGLTVTLTDILARIAKTAKDSTITIVTERKNPNFILTIKFLFLGPKSLHQV